MSLKLCVFLLLGLFFSAGAKCQKMAVKSNLLYDATATINAGVEFRLAPRWTFDVSGNYNGWTISGDRKWKHWMLQPEARYWLCDRFAGHFLGAHVLGGKYNVGNLKNSISFLGTDFSKLTDRRYQGWFVGAGWLTGTRGYSRGIGISRRKLAWGIFTRVTTCILVPSAGRDWQKDGRIITWDRRKRR